MMKFLRSQSQTVLVIVLGVIGLGFLFYGSAGNVLTATGARASNDYGRIDGEDLSVAELYDAVRNTRNSLVIHGQSKALQRPGAAQQVAEEAWRQLLLLHEADKLHVNVSDQEVINYIQSMPIFQKNGVYDPDTYSKEMQVLRDVLRVPSDTGTDPVEATKTVFETLVKNDLRTAAVSKALFSTARVSAQDVSDQYQKYYGPITVSVINFDPKDFAATSGVTGAEVEAEYKAHPENPAYRTAEKRKVDYVLFLLSPEQQKLSAEQKSAAKDALGQKALDFALAFQPNPTDTGAIPPPPPDFAAEARKIGMTAGTTDFFAADATPSGLPPSPAFNSAAFTLTKNEPVSKVVDLDNGVAVLHLGEIQPSELRPLGEVQADIQKKLAQQNSTSAAQLAAQINAKSLQNQVAGGVDFKAAAGSLKLKVQTLPTFIPVKAPSTDPIQQAAAYASISLKPGQASDPIPTQGDKGSIIVHLDRRDPPDPAGLADFENRFRQSQDQQVQGAVYNDWAEWKSNQPGTHKPPDLEAYGSIE